MAQAVSLGSFCFNPNLRVVSLGIGKRKFNLGSQGFNNRNRKKGGDRLITTQYFL
ncbi:MAG: hypothetical protein WBB82_13395 [Limnothrix sp.]